LILYFIKFHCPIWLFSHIQTQKASIPARVVDLARNFEAGLLV
jgi:hypothetical protein